MTRHFAFGLLVFAAVALVLPAVVRAQVLELENVDGLPFPDLLAFNRIGKLSSPPPNGVHERSVIRVGNTGQSVLTIKRLILKGPDRTRWSIENAPALPLGIPPGSSVDLVLRFTAQIGRRVHEANLNISSNDAAQPTVVVNLRGYWQNVSENGKEPSLQQILDVFGYTTILAGDGEQFDTRGKRMATGEEVLSAYWRRVDTSQPVTVRQIAAFHPYPGGHEISWHYFGSTTTTSVFRHEAEDAQSVLPRMSENSQPAAGEFSPSTTVGDGHFGFRIQEDQWSDPTYNDSSNDDCSGGPSTCGQHVRFWPARDRQGIPLPNTFIMAMDFTGVSYGYQDNVYLVSNVSPAPALLERPYVTGTSPADGAVDIRRDAFVAVDVLLPNVGQGIDASTLTSSSVKLYPAGRPGDVVPANLNTSGGGDAIVLQPSMLLAANTPYVFEINEGVKDYSGTSFLPKQISFSTGPIPTGPLDSSIQFEKVPLSGTAGRHTTVAIGPDGKLYATQNDGLIKRWRINADGSLSEKELLNALQVAEGGDRLLIGLVFDPAATSTNLIAWVSHSTFGFSGMPEWDSKITRLSGPNLETVQDYVVDLPRSIRDHVTNSLSFGPDGALYALQGSNSAMGEADNAWGNRPERKLTAAVLRVDVSALDALASRPLNVRTDVGTYDPYSPDAPVKIFASGIRNAYDLVWHSNGSLYIPTNGSAANGKAPASVAGTIRPDLQPYNGPDIPSIDSIATQNDYLFRVPAPSGGSWDYRYYGHPNPSRGEFVLNGGNPTSTTDVAEVSRYPVGISPDAAWNGIAFNFGRNISPNGVIEYRSTALGGALTGKLLVVRYSGGDDIIVLTPDPSTGNIPPSGDLVGIAGFTKFADPIDIVENRANGHLYVSEYSGSGTITLVRPVTATPNQTPEAAFTITPDSGTVPLTVAFDGSGSFDSDGIIESYNWDFDGDAVVDLSTVVPSGVTHIYSTAGTYNATLTVRDNNGASAIATNVITASGAAVIAFVEAAGQVTIEAENYDDNVSRSGQSWVSKDLAGSVGASMRPEPVMLTNHNSDFVTTSPELQYRIHVNTTGTYYVWARAYSVDGNSDSWHVGLDHQAFDSADRMTMGPTFLRWRWINKTMDAEPATIQVAASGIHVLNVWMREDGVYLDRLLLTTDPTYVPSGTGPAESPRIEITNAVQVFEAREELAGGRIDLAAVNGDALPDRFDLSDNYPNPFNPVTTIQYSLPEEVRVTLEVFDLLGRRVDVLVDAVQLPGIYRAVFDASALASGVYLYRLKAGSFVRVSRMIVSK